MSDPLNPQDRFPHDRFPQRDVGKVPHPAESPRRLSDGECFRRAKERGQSTFTLVAQDASSPRVICEWIKENIETCGSAKLFEALGRAIEMRDNPLRKRAD